MGSNPTSCTILFIQSLNKPDGPTKIEAPQTAKHPRVPTIQAYKPLNITKMSSFLSRFAVFRGSSIHSIGMEWADSVMIFDATPCDDDDGEFYAVTLRPWVPGSFVLDENPEEPDTICYNVKIHAPVMSDFADNHRYMRTPYSIVKHLGGTGLPLEASLGLFEFSIPVLMFQDTTWMHDLQTITPMYRHTLICGEQSQLHIRHSLFLAYEHMRLHPTITRFLESNKNLYDLTQSQHYDEPNRTKEQWIAHWYTQLFCNTMEEPDLYALASAAQLPDGDEEEEAEAPVPEGPFAPLGWIPEPSQWPVFVYQNHVHMERSKGTECAITLTPLTDMPSVAVNPTCGHIFEPAALTSWITSCREKGEIPLCPTCRIAIPNGAMLISIQ